MKSLHLALVIAILILPASAAIAVTFDFDTGTPTLRTGQGTPFNQTSEGLIVHFSSPGDQFGPAYSIQTDVSTQFHLSQFSGHYIYPNSLTMNFLDMEFSKPLESISMTFATADFQQVEVPTTVQLNAFANSSMLEPVGSAAAHGTYASDTMPMGTISFSSATKFNLVRIGIPFQPMGATDFLVDNVIVATAPPPVPDASTLLLFATGVLPVAGLLLRRRTT